MVVGYILLGIIAFWIISTWILLIEYPDDLWPHFNHGYNKYGNAIIFALQALFALPVLIPIGIFTIGIIIPVIVSSVLEYPIVLILEFMRPKEEPKKFIGPIKYIIHQVEVFTSPS
jgi:hypothetical protein